MEKRNYVTSLRTADCDRLEKDASFEDEIEKVASDFTEQAIAEDEASDRDYYKHHG